MQESKSQRSNEGTDKHVQGAFMQRNTQKGKRQSKRPTDMQEHSSSSLRHADKRILGHFAQFLLPGRERELQRLRQE